MFSAASKSKTTVFFNKGTSQGHKVIDFIESFERASLLEYECQI